MFHLSTIDTGRKNRVSGGVGRQAQIVRARVPSCSTLSMSHFKWLVCQQLADKHDVHWVGQICQEWSHLSWPSIFDRCDVGIWHPPQTRTWFSCHRFIVTKRCRFALCSKRVKAFRTNYNAMWLFQNNHIANTILIVACLHRRHNDFCESARQTPKKWICRARRQMIIPTSCVFISTSITY